MKELTIELNAKLQPMHREEMLEEPLKNALLEAKAGDLVGGGTLLSATGEVAKCDITLSVKDEWVEKVRAFLQEINAIPKGSKIICDEKVTPIGQAEGLAIYLNGTDLPAKVYQSNDINDLIAELQNALGENCFMFSWWESGTKTALYFYGESYSSMYESIKHILDSHPLCQLSQTKQIA